MLIALFAIAGIASASNYSISSINSLLSSYNLSSSLVNSLQYTNISYNAGSYVALYHSGSLFLVVNVTKGYSIMDNQTAIYNVMKDTIVNKSLSGFSFNALKAEIHSYQSSAAPSLSSCLSSIGYYTGMQCNATSCFECMSVPSCNMELYQSGGPGGLMIPAIEQMDAAASKLNSTYLQLYSELNTTNASNAASRLQSLSSLFKNITSTYNNMQTNVLFPPPTNLTTTQIDSCVNYPVPTSAPWFCVSLSYCNYITTNQSASTAVALRLQQLNSEISTQAIQSKTNAAYTNANLYIAPLILKQKQSQFNMLLNTSFSTYAVTVNNTNNLLSHVNDPQLQESLLLFKSAYANFTALFMSENLTASAASLSIKMKALQSMYSEENSTYTSALRMSQNNTMLLLKEQLNSQQPSAAVGSLAFKEANINNELSEKASNITSAYALLKSINSEASEYNSSGGFSAFALTSSIDSPFVRMIAPLFGLSYSSSVSLSPALSMLIPLIVAIIVIMLLLLYYYSLKKKKRLRSNADTRRSWFILFLIIIIIALIWMAVTYTSASEASASTLSMFNSAVSGSGRLFIIANGTSPGITSCIAEIQSTADSMSKNVEIAYITGNRCTVNGTLETSQSCMAAIASSGTPAIILQDNSTDSISVYSYYGTYLKAAGDSSFIGKCYPAKLLS
jgi:heme/copper-type cytochrome/quinol oxidase subunit 4